jgi:vacuolar protein sorting-associated protein 72
LIDSINLILHSSLFSQEPEPDEEQPQIDADERMNKKKRLVYPGKTLAKKKKKKKTLSNLDNKSSKNDDDEDDNNKNNATEDQHDDAKEIMIRKSTRTSVIVRQAERDAIRAAIQATSKVITHHHYSILSISM